MGLVCGYTAGLTMGQGVRYNRRVWRWEIGYWDHEKSVERPPALLASFRSIPFHLEKEVET